MDARARASAVQDVALAVGITALALAEIWVPLPSVLGAGSPEASTAMVLVMGAALAVRRVRPLPALLVVLLSGPVVAVVAPVHVLFWGGLVPVMLALYSVARHCGGRQAWAGVGAAAAAFVVLDLTVEELQDTSEILFHWGVAAVVVGIGRTAHRMDRRAQESIRRAGEAEAAAAERTAAALAQERARIARELHDVVAHSVSVMVVQAGAAEQVVQDDPEFARAALGRIRTTGSEALAEMRRVLAVLRDEEADGALAPQPGLAAVTDLLERTATGDLRTSLVVDGAPRPLPPGVDLAAYRIVQEALTNVRRHARATTVTVAVRYGERAVEVEVVDDGRGAATDPISAADAGGRGHGLVGMRERVALYGGHLELGGGADGFRVRAVLPVGAP